MDILTFTSKLVEALVWPITILFIILILRRPILNLIPFLQRFKFKELELEFDKKVHELVTEAKLTLPEDINKFADEPSAQKLAGLAEISPRASILESWLELENAALDAIKKNDIHITNQELRSPLSLGNALEKAGVIDGNKLSIFHKLRNLRNAATHAYDFALDPMSAIEFSRLALSLAKSIRSFSSNT